MKTEKNNIGKELAFEIKDKGYSKKAIAKLLCITYNTLMERLKDGEFTHSQYRKLVENRYLSEQ